MRRGSSSYPVKPQKKSQTKDDSAESSEGTAVSKKEKEVASSEGENDSEEDVDLESHEKNIQAIKDAVNLKVQVQRVR